MAREDDSISRKEVLQMIDNIREAGGFIGFNTYSEAFDQVNNMSSVPRWIPITERLPEENGKYLVKYRRRDEKINVSIDYFLKSNDDSEFWGYDVIGWLPIPEYKENKE